MFRFKFPSVNIFINTYYFITIILIATRRPHLHSHQSDAPQNVKTLDSTVLKGLIRASKC
jgi:hypothetical protein